MDRRRFLRDALACSVAPWARAAWGLSSATQAHSEGATAAETGGARRASVVDFGADPTGEKDATQAVRSAIASLGKTSARLVFPAGSYRFAPSSSPVMDFSGYQGLEIFGNGALLLFAGLTPPLRLVGSANIEVHDLRFDWAALPCVEGNLLEAHERSLVLRVTGEPFSAAGGGDDAWPVRSLMEYDAHTRLPARGGYALGTELDDRAAEVGKARRLAGGRLLVEFTAPLPAGAMEAAGRRLLDLRAGSPVVVWPAVAAPPMIEARLCSEVLVESVTLNGGPGLGVLFEGCHGVQLDDLEVGPAAGSGRMLSTCGGAVKLVDCSGNVSMRACELRGMGDDGVAIFQSFLRLTQVLDAQTALVKGTGPALAPWQIPGAGSFLQLVEAEHMTLLGEVAVEAAQPFSGGAKLRFEETLSPLVTPGTLLCNAMAEPRTTVQHCQFTGNRGNGLVMHRRGQILNNRFAGCSGPGLLMAPDTYRLEGPMVGSMNLVENTFENCNYAPAGAARGAVTVDTALARSALVTPAAAVNQGVTLRGNHFHSDGPGEGVALYVAGTSWLTVEENTFDVGTSGAAAGGQAPVAIALRRVDQAFLQNNVSRTPASLEMIDCTDKVQTAGNTMLVDHKH